MTRLSDGDVVDLGGEGSSGPASIAVDSDGLYAVRRDAELLRFEVGEDAWVSLSAPVEDAHATDMAMDEEHAYVVSSNSHAIYRISKSGGASEVFWYHEDGQPCGLALDDHHLYWTTCDGNIMRMRKAGEASSPPTAEGT